MTCTERTGEGNGEDNMERISKAIVEFIGACDTKVTVDLSHVEYIKEDKMIVGNPGTMIYFMSGNKLFVNAEYDQVRDMLNDFRMGTNTGIEE